MGIRGVAAHVDADLGKDGLGAEVVEARDSLHHLDGLAKGVEIGLHLLVDPRDRPIEGVDLLQMKLEQEAVMGGQAALQRRSSSGVALIRRSAKPAKTAGSVWPAIIASIMARPLTPMMSEMTESSLMLASSSVFCSR